MEKHFQEAVKTIDKEFGRGFAKKNPSLIIGLVNSSIEKEQKEILFKKAEKFITPFVELFVEQLKKESL